MNSEDRAEAMLNYLESRREEIIDFAGELIATPSVNPPGDERAVTQVIIDKLESLGLEGAEIVARAPQPDLSPAGQERVTATHL